MIELIKNTPKRPKWTDRQQISAADLTAEQDWQDTQLVRLRRLMLGWGVVAGLEVKTSGNSLQINPGLGVTTAGGEIYLQEAINIEEVFELLCDACGKTEDHCAEPILENTEIRERAPFKQFSGWLILRPKVLESCPRPTIPQGCSHPGSDFAYSRQINGLEPYFVCTLKAEFQRPEPDCKLVERYLDESTVPMPDLADDFLPIARLIVRSKTEIHVDMSKRRKLIPLSVLQDIVSCCECDTETPIIEEEPDIGDGNPWGNPSNALIKDLVGSIQDALPKVFFEVTDSFDLKFADIFETGNASTSGLKSFAASLLVKDKIGLKNFAINNYDEIYKGFWKTGGTRTAPTILINDTHFLGVKLTPGTKLSDAWTSKQTGYHLLVKNFGDKRVGEIEGRITDAMPKRYEMTAAIGWLKQHVDAPQ